MQDLALLISTIAELRDLTPTLYRTFSISLWTFFNSSSESFNNFEQSLNRFAFIHIEMFCNFFDVALLVHDDGTYFFIPFKFYS